MLDRLLPGLLLLGAWQFATLFWSEYAISSPIAAASSFMRFVISGELFRHIYYTLHATAYGFLIGAPLGIALPFLLRRQATIRAILDPYLIAGYGIPKLALAPLFIVWFGIGIGSKVALVVSVSFFILFFNTSAGVRAVDRRLVAMGRVAGASERNVLYHIVWPSAVPYIFAGLKTALPNAIGGVVVTELISSNRGLGYLIQYSANRFNTSDVFAALAGVLILVVLANWMMALIETKLLHWRPKGTATTSRAEQAS